MNPRIFIAGISLVALHACFVSAATTIDPVNKYAYGGNLGWLDWSGDTVNGASVNDYYCSGYIYAANVGWINLGGGSPVNQVHYQNNSAADFGVNNDGLGNLRGYAWGANIGWVNFESTGAPAINLKTGRFSGYVWSANCGWLSLSNAFAFVQTDHILPGPLSTNGLPIPWLVSNFGTTNINPNADADGDGMSNAQEYLAGTDPNNANDFLRITAESFGAGGTTAMLTWSSVPTRFYYLQKSTLLNPPSGWVDSGLGLLVPDSGTTTTRAFGDVSAAIRFYRVDAVRPLP
jgi:hypothetical protein